MALTLGHSALALLLGATVAYYLIFVLIGWLFCQAVFFTVKLCPSESPLTNVVVPLAPQEQE